MSRKTPAKAQTSMLSGYKKGHRTRITTGLTVRPTMARVVGIAILFCSSIILPRIAALRNTADVVPARDGSRAQRTLDESHCYNRFKKIKIKNYKKISIKIKKEISLPRVKLA